MRMPKMSNRTAGIISISFMIVVGTIAAFDILVTKEAPVVTEWMMRSTTTQTNSNVYIVNGCREMPEISMFEVALRSGTKVISAFSHHMQMPGEQVTVTKIKYYASSINCSLASNDAAYFVND